MNPSIGLIISTLNEGILKIEEMLASNVDEIIVVHQLTEADSVNQYRQFYASHQKPHIRFIEMQGKGLSRSRNEGLIESNADYVLICDDDGIFENGFEDLLRTTIQKFPKADIFTFKTRTPDGRPYKKYRDEVYQHSKRTTAKVTSREILISRRWLEISGIRFDERFGLGTDIPTGEEYIFLCDAIRKNATILFIPEFIVVHPYESSGKEFGDKHAIAKGKVFARTYGWVSPAVSILFSVKKYDHYRKRISLFRYTRMILKGNFQFLRNG